MGVPRVVRSPFAPVAAVALGEVASLVRWALQGSGNLYTAFDKRFYVADADLGWRVSPDHPVWLGLELCAVILALACALVVAAFLIRRRERTRGARSTVLRVLTWGVAVGSLAAPALAFATGWRPPGARDTLPASDAVRIESGIAGSLAAPAGHYVVVPHAGTSITAHLVSGGEAFDARFDHDITGAWDGDPRDLSQPNHAEIRVATAAVDTGIRARSKHAREGFLHAETFPEIAVGLDRIIAVRSDVPGTIDFRAAATVRLMGKAHAVEVTGTMKRPDAAALQRLGLTGDVLLVQAELALVVRETALAAKAGDFDGERIPIHASLVLRRAAD